jgi:hypothetical protein
MHVFLVSGLNAYPPDKPSLGIPNDELKALSQVGSTGMNMQPWQENAS